MSAPTFSVPVCHPHYSTRREQYRFVRAAYLGGPEFCASYLTPHPKERTSAFSRRLERAVYPNLCKVQVNTYSAQLYRSPVARSVKPAEGESAREAEAGDELLAQEVLEDLWDDVDRLGNNADTFFKGVASWCQVFGLSAVLVDRVQLPEGAPTPSSRADEIALGLRPYLVHIQADHILDWQCDARGEFDWILYVTEAEEDRDPLTLAPASTAWTYVLWTREEVRELAFQAADAETKKAAGWQALTTRPNPLGLVPVELVFWGERQGRHPLADSALADLAPMNRRLMNLINLVDEEVYQHVFNILAVGESTFDTLAATNWSVAGVLKVRKEDFAPTYLAPGVEQIGAISDEVEKCIRFMRMLSGNVGRGVDDGFVPPSGVSLAYQSSDKFALFKEFSNRMSDLERRVADLALAWEGIAPPGQEVSIEYAQDFDPVLAARTFEDGLAFQSLALGGEPDVENEVQIIRRYFAGSMSPGALGDMIAAHRARRAEQPQARAVEPVTTPAQPINLEPSQADFEQVGATASPTAQLNF